MIEASRLGLYTLDDEYRPVPASDALAWAEWMNKRQLVVVAQEDTNFYWVSTVFLGVDRCWDDGPPLLFETMVSHREREVSEMFGRLLSMRESVDDGDMVQRYTSWDDAEAGHKTMVRRLRKLEAASKVMVP